jgi:multiple sugar transport system substrate-binding protein
MSAPMMSRRVLLARARAGVLGTAAVGLLAACGGTAAVGSTSGTVSVGATASASSTTAPTASAPATTGSAAVASTAARTTPATSAAAPEATAASTTGAATSPVPAASTAPAAAAVELHYATDWTSGVRGKTQVAAVQQFGQQFPKYRIVVDPIVGDYYEKLSTQINSGTVADIMLFSGAFFLKFQQSGAFADISPYLSSLKVNLKDYTIVPGVSQAAGKVYGMPFQLTVVTWYANMDMFQKAAVALPEAGWNWNDLLTVAQKLTNPDQKQWGIRMANSVEGGWGPLVLSAGGHFLNQDQTKTAFMDGDGLDGFQFAADLVTKYRVAPSPAESKALPGDLFQNNHVAIIPANSSSVGGYTTSINSRFRWEPIPQPAYPKTNKVVTTFNDQPNLIAKQSKDVEGAVQFAVFMAGDYVQGLIADDRGSTPVLRTLQQSDRYLKSPPPNVAQVVKNLAYAVDLDFVPNWLAWDTAVQDKANLAFTGQDTAAGALKQAISAGDQALAGA